MAWTLLVAAISTMKVNWGAFASMEDSREYQKVSGCMKNILQDKWFCIFLRALFFCLFIEGFVGFLRVENTFSKDEKLLFLRGGNATFSSLCVVHDLPLFLLPSILSFSFYFFLVL